MNPVHQKDSIPRLLLLIILALGLLGTGVELLLLGHTEDVWQWVPLILLAAGLIIIGIWVRRRRRWSLRAFQATMLLCVVAGPVGMWQHYTGNVEFELEMTPAMSGLELFGEAMTGAMPALAPGAMVQLGLLGLLYAFRHPAFRSAVPDQEGERT